MRTRGDTTGDASGDASSPPPLTLSLSLDASFLRFAVTSCEEAVVRLLRLPDDTSSVAYTVVIGANENTVTRLYRVVNEIATPLKQVSDAQ